MFSTFLAECQASLSEEGGGGGGGGGRSLIVRQWMLTLE